MRIEQILLKGYRQFKDLTIDFPAGTNNDLHVFIGENGTGKTNLLNAMNWCLYGDEPHLSSKSQRLPLLNLISVEGSEQKGQRILVEILAKTDDGRDITFRRRAYITVQQAEGQPPRVMFQGSNLEVDVVDEDESTEIVEDEIANSYVERFLPKSIREFFFFDGERLDRYFKEATAQNIRHAVFEISQIDLLQDIENKLTDCLKELRREAGRTNPEIEKVTQLIDKEQQNAQQTDEMLKECNRQVSIAKERIAECEKNLAEIPDIEILERDLSRLRSSKEKKKEVITSKRREKRDLLVEYWKIIPLWRVIHETSKLILEKRSKGEIPPTGDRSLLETILTDRFCSICGRPLDPQSEEKLRALLHEIKVSSILKNRLMEIEGPILAFTEKIANFEKEIKAISRDIEIYGSDLSEIEEKIAEIDRKLSGYNLERIRQWHEERKTYYQTLEQNQKKLGFLTPKKEFHLKKKRDLEAQLNEELRREQRARKIKAQIDFCTKALDVSIKVKDRIMEQTRERIETQTKELFFQLLWKKQTYRDVKIDSDYNINLFHAMGYECLGTTGAAERELLALSFTLALHKVSGFNSPILIDTPVARVSGAHRENFGRVLAEVGQMKQTILLFTPDEYSEDIRKTLDNKCISRHQLKMLSNERETREEVLTNG